MKYQPIASTEFKAGMKWETIEANLKINWEHLKEIDEKAKARGELLWRFFSVSVADGKAFYQVTKVNKTTARVEWCDGICPDNYYDQVIGGGSTLPLSKVKQWISGRDYMDKLFSKNKTGLK